MDNKLRKNRGFTVVLQILTACVILLLLSATSVSAKAKNGKYSFSGSPYMTKKSLGKLKIKKHKMTIKGGYTLFNNGKGWKSLKKKKRTFTLSKKCRFYAWPDQYGKYPTDKKSSYKTFVKRSKQWVKAKGSGLAGNYNNINFTVKKGKVVKVQMEWMCGPAL